MGIERIAHAHRLPIGNPRLSAPAESQTNFQGLYRNGNRPSNAMKQVNRSALLTSPQATNNRISLGSGRNAMNAEGDCPSVRGARLEALIGQLEQVLAELDGLGLNRIALPVNEAIELARANRVSVQNGPIGGRRLG